MSALMLLLLAQAAAPMSVDEASARGYPTGLSFEMEAAIAPAVDRYSLCLNRHMNMQVFRPGEIEPRAEEAIAKCKGARADAMIEADVALAGQPGWDLKSKRETEVRADFDNTDASFLKVAKETDVFTKRRPKQ